MGTTTMKAWIDITNDVCPMTFVRVKLKVEALPPGSLLEIRLNGGEPLENVPRSLRDEGCDVVRQEPDGAAWLLTVRTPPA